MKRKVMVLLVVMLSIVCVNNFNHSKTIISTTIAKEYKANNTSGDLIAGTYSSADGKSIVVSSTGSVLYENTYTLTVNKATTGTKITGKIGSSNTSATFYQLNASTILSNTTITYTYNGVSTTLYEYTAFNLATNPTNVESGNYEVYDGATKTGAYSTLQDAVDASSTGNTIKILKSETLTDGVYVRNKTLTIDGNNNTLTRSVSSNSVIVLEYNANVTIKNLTIDGGSTGFKVDYDSVTYTNYTIPLLEGSQENDKKLNLSSIITKGVITTDNVTIKNNYTASNGAGLYIVSGKATIKNSNFLHNNANDKKGKGAAIYAGRKFKDGETSYPISKIIITNTNFDNNYTGAGGAFYLYNVDKVEIKDSNFLNNTADGLKGGAINIDGEGTTDPKAESLGLDYTYVTIDNTIFDNNWAGNDGFAIQSYEGILTITNSKFSNNTGTHPTSSVGTISVESYRKNTAMKTYIDNTTFEGNKGPCSVFGDHSTKDSTVVISNSTFKENNGSESILLYSSVTTISDCEFINEDSQLATIDARIYENLDIPPSITIENTTFEGNEEKQDVLVRKQGHNEELNTYTIIFKGTNTANVAIWDNNEVTVEGSLTGNIELDGTTSTENFVVKENASHNGTIVENKNTYTVLIFYPTTDIASSYETVYVPTDKTTLTDAELFLYHNLEKEGYKLEYYTDSSKKNLWDYSVAGHLNLYTKWAEHEHSYSGELSTHGSSIYEQCTCGKINKELSIIAPTELVYNGKSKGVTLLNTFNANEDEYKVSYQYKDKDGSWKTLDGIPIEVGTYKAILEYKELIVEKEYTITKEVENPYTSTSLIKIISLILIVGSIIVLINTYKNTKINKYE